MTSRLHKLAALSAVLAAGTFAAPALALPQATGNAGPVAPVYQDLRSPDTRDAALHPHYLPPRTAPQPPTWPAHPQPITPPAAHTAASGNGGDGLGTAPLAGIVAAAAAALAAATRVTLRRRQARSVA
jgi:hypothetical protein